MNPFKDLLLGFAKLLVLLILGGFVLGFGLCGAFGLLNSVSDGEVLWIAFPLSFAGFLIMWLSASWFRKLFRVFFGTHSDKDNADDSQT